MKTYNYELAPVSSTNRGEHTPMVYLGTLVAKDYGTATQMAATRARELSTERGNEYGLVRIW